MTKGRSRRGQSHPLACLRNPSGRRPRSTGPKNGWRCRRPRQYQFEVELIDIGRVVAELPAGRST